MRDTLDNIFGSLAPLRQSLGGPGRRVEEACPPSRSPSAGERKDLASVTL